MLIFFSTFPAVDNWTRVFTLGVIIIVWYTNCFVRKCNKVLEWKKARGVLNKVLARGEDFYFRRCNEPTREREIKMSSSRFLNAKCNQVQSYFCISLVSWVLNFLVACSSRNNYSKTSNKNYFHFCFLFLRISLAWYSTIILTQLKKKKNLMLMYK